MCIRDSFGTVQINANGSCTYALDSSSPAVTRLSGGETGVPAGVSLTENFRYAVKDGKGKTATAELSIVIKGANEADQTDKETQADPEQVAEVADSNNERGSMSLITTAPAKGIVVVNPDSSVTYTPNEDINACLLYTSPSPRDRG